VTELLAETIASYRDLVAMGQADKDLSDKVRTQVVYYLTQAKVLASALEDVNFPTYRDRLIRTVYAIQPEWADAPEGAIGVGLILPWNEPAWERFRGIIDNI